MGGESYYIKQKVITYAGAPHMGCNEMWVCPAYWPHFTEKVKQYIEQNTTNTQGGRREAPVPFGRCRRQRFCCIFSMYCLTFSVRCCQNAGHTQISLHPMWGTPAKVMTFQQNCNFPAPPVGFRVLGFRVSCWAEGLFARDLGGCRIMVAWVLPNYGLRPA